MTPDVSIVIPTIGKDQRLRRTLDSIKAMTGPGFEVVVVDQSGGGNVARWMADYDVTRFRHVPQSGRGRARAIVCGVSRACGKYVAMTDDDVVVEPDWLGAALRFFERHGPCDAVVGRVSQYGDRPGPHYLPPQQLEWPSERRLRASGLWHGFGANQILKRRSWDAVGGMDPRLGIGGRCPSSDDWDLLYRMLVCGMSVWYNPDVRVWHDGWETVENTLRKSKMYDRANMAAHIKCWTEVGGPALRDVACRCGRFLSGGIDDLLHRRRGCATANFMRLGHFMQGIPLGLRLAWEGKAVHRDRRPRE